MTDLRFDGRVAVVTGAGRGIGREHALMFAGRGAAVVVNDLGCAIDGTGHSSDPAEDVVREIRAAGGTAIPSIETVATEAGAEKIINTAIDAFGRVDVVVNNAGILITGPIDKVTPAEFLRTIDVTVTGAYLMIRAAWPHFQRASYGRIVNTTSSTIFGHRFHTAYGAAKAAVFGLTRSVALEGADSNILANAIAPSGATRMFRYSVEGMLSDELIEQLTEQLHPRENAALAGYLGHETCELNGAVLACTGPRAFNFFLAANDGYSSEGLSPELVKENLPTVMDRARYTAFANAEEMA
jgi:NAD(P)-dependent dehydrogenase (short-subunit alcohol dehydrogenase family)